MSIKKCPKCGMEYRGSSIYCRKCGVELIMVENRCSKQRRSVCKTQGVKQSDDYCEYCGSLTLYGLERKR